MFCVFYGSHLGIWHFELWGISRVAKISPAKLSLAKVSPGEFIPRPLYDASNVLGLGVNSLLEMGTAKPNALWEYSMQWLRKSSVVVLLM